MASLWPLAAALPLAVHALTGFPADNRMVERPGLVRYPISVVDGAPAKDRLFRRQNDFGLAPQKSGFFYAIEVKLGTPPQAVKVNFDTGSDELWVNPTCSKSTDPAFCQSFGRFNGSQTFVDVKRNSTINYGTGFANLEYGYDYVKIGCTWTPSSSSVETTLTCQSLQAQSAASRRRYPVRIRRQRYPRRRPQPRRLGQPLSHSHRQPGQAGLHQKPSFLPRHPIVRDQARLCRLWWPRHQKVLGAPGEETHYPRRPVSRQPNSLLGLPRRHLHLSLQRFCCQRLRQTQRSGRPGR